MVVVKWREYKIMVFKSLVKRLVIFVWFLVFFFIVFVFIMEMLKVDVMILEKIYVVWCVSVVVVLIFIFFFYIMVYCGICKCNISEIG